MKEEYRDINGYEGYYQISNLGNIKSLDRKVSIKGSKRLHNAYGKVMNSHIGRDGYCQICLCKNSKRSTRKIHRLVAIAFIDNPTNKRCVNHIDMDKTNNNLVNLEWLTHKENTLHYVKTKKLKGGF